LPHCARFISAVDPSQSEGRALLDAAGFRLGCLRVLSMLATSEARCVALLAPPSALASVCVAVCRHKYDLEGTRCAVNILRNLALPPSCVPGLLAAGALG
jgi:hypothetical protein